MNRILPLLLLLLRHRSAIVPQFVWSLCRCRIAPITSTYISLSLQYAIISCCLVSAADDGSGTPMSSYSSFYIRPAAAAIRVAVATATAADTDPPPTAADDDKEIPCILLHYVLISK